MLDVEKLIPSTLDYSLKAAFGVANMGVWGWDEITQGDIWPPQTKAILGLSPETEMTRELFVGLLHPDDAPRHQAAWAAAMNPHGARLYQLSYRIRRASDGAERWISSDAHVEFRGDSPIKVLGALRDVTEEYVMLAQLRESAQRLRLLFEASSNVMYCMSPDWGELRYAAGGDIDIAKPNRAWLMDFIPPDEQQRVLAAIEEAIQSRSVFELEHRVLKADGCMGWTLSRAIPLFGRDGEIVEWIGSATDMTARKDAERALRESERRKSFLLALGDALKPLSDSDDVKDISCGTLGREIGGNQVLYAEIDSTGVFADITRDWRDGSIRSNVVRHKLDDFGPDFVADLKAGKTIAIGDVTVDPRTNSPEALARYRIPPIAAFICVPLVKDGVLVCVLSVHCRSPRQWSALDISLAEEVAERTWASVRRADAEKALRESDERLRFALSGAGAAAWQWNVASNRSIWAPDFFRLHGREPETDEPSYALWLESVHPHDRAEAESAIHDALEQRAAEYRSQYRVLLPNGEVRWLSVIGAVDRDSAGSPLRMSGIALDVTAQKRAELALRQSETKLRQSQIHLRHAADAARLTYADIDLTAERLHVAENFANVMGYEPPNAREGADLSEALARLLGRVAPADHALIQNALREILAGGQSGKLEYRVLGDDGSERWIDGMWSVEHGPDRQPVRAFATSLDISGLKATEAALRRAKQEAERANRAKSKFLASASHDLRQPVQSLVLLLSLIERQVAANPKAIETANLMKQALGGLNGLLTSILDISRLDAGVVEPAIENVELAMLLGRLGDEYAAMARSRGLELRIAPSKLRALADPTLLERALRNLIENALRYTHSGGVLIGLRLRGKSVRIDVIDTGIGVPAEKRTEIFDEFIQLNNPGRDLAQGLGLGLAIVARVAALMDAKIEVASRIGRGSRFSLSLPLGEAPAAVVAETSQWDDPGGRVLIVEDNAIVRYGLESLTQQWGYQALVAASGEEALEVAEAHGWAVEAIITDYRLGAGLSGVDAAKEIERRAGRVFPTLILTGDTAKNRISEISASGFDLLHKPVDAENLRRKLAQLIAT